MAYATHSVVIMLFMERLESDEELKQEEGVETKLAVSVLYIS